MFPISPLIAYALFPAVMMAPFHLMTCLEQTISRHFPTGHVIVFSLPSEEISTPRRSIHNANEKIVSISDVIAYVSNKTKLPLLISTDSQEFERDIPEPQHGYVIFLFPEEDILDSLEIQIEALRSYTFSYNRRGRFVVVVLDGWLGKSQTLAKDILITLWKMDNIVNSVVMIRTSGDIENTSDEEHFGLYDVYTLFPYQSEHCGESEDVVLVGQWTPANGFENSDTLFPEKVPPDLRGCIWTAEISYSPPYGFLNNYTDVNGNVAYELEGVNSVFLQFASRGMNFSLRFVKWLSLNDWYVRMTNANVISIGYNALSPQLCSFADVTVPHFYISIDLYVPRALRNAVSGNFLQVFSVLVWSLLVLLLILVAVLFRSYQRDETSLSRAPFSECLLKAWAVHLSVSVDCASKKPEFRVFFILFVLYCFAVNTIFQSFFTSFLVEPGFEKQIETIEDLNQRDMPLFLTDGMKLFEYFTGFSLSEKFKTVESCSDTTKCLENVCNRRSGAVLVEKHFAEYQQALAGVGDDQKLYNIWTVVSFFLVFTFRKGLPLQERFNSFIHKCLESGLPHRYYCELIRNITIENVNRNLESTDLFIAFNLAHLKMCFLLLGLGYVVSLFVFISERNSTLMCKRGH
ncbi:Ionotropic receptor 732 [Blattella germanica]|nr:Ionotropic receptor 732 [Blattella germanica]